MVGLLINWLLDALVIFAVAKLVPGVSVKDYSTALVASAVLAFFSVFLGWALTLLTSIVTFPAILLTFGLFYFVVRFFVNVVLLSLTASMVSGFTINGLMATMTASLLISFGQQIVSALR